MKDGRVNLLDSGVIKAVWAMPDKVCPSDPEGYRWIIVKTSQKTLIVRGCPNCHVLTVDERPWCYGEPNEECDCEFFTGCVELWKDEVFGPKRG